MKHGDVVICIIIFIFIVIFVCGCGQKTGSLDLLGEGVKKVSLDPVTLTFYFIDKGYNQDTIREVLDGIEKKAAKSLNVKLNFTFIPYFVYRDTMKRIITQRDPCDMFEYNTCGSVDFLEEAYEEGYALDITDLFPQYAPSYYSKLDACNLAVHQRHNRQVAVPNNFTLTNTMCAIVRDDLMQKYNIPPIKSLDDFEVYLDTVNKNENILITLAVNETI
jgi:putative aldouronate transport system substrate-binding protein